MVAIPSCGCCSRRSGLWQLFLATLTNFQEISQNTSSQIRKNYCLSTPDAVDCLLNHCPRTFRRAVRDSGDRFLYRGETQQDKCPQVLCPAPDLLDLSTYGDEQAVEFFTCLEQELTAKSIQRLHRSDRVLLPVPSMSHIGTADKRVAAQWGTPVSVWPLADTNELFGYLWPRDNDLIFPGNLCPSRNRIVGKNARDTGSILIVNDGLDDALRSGKEVMLTSLTGKLEAQTASCFLVFPSTFEDDLRYQLKRINYGL